MFQQMLSQGQEMARTFNPALEHFDVKAFEKMFPTMPADMLEMWFGKTFNREGLDAKTRLLLTIGAAGWDIALPDLRSRMGAALHLAIAEPDDAMAAAHWRRFDLQHGLPRLHGEQVEAWTPQQLSLERLHAFSVKKGCYPGQEIVARTHFLGKAKRGLMRLQGAGIGALGDVMAGTPGEAAPVDARAIGQLICAEGDEGLAVMPLDAGDGPFSSDDRICRQLPLRDGLAR